MLGVDGFQQTCQAIKGCNGQSFDLAGSARRGAQRLCFRFGLARDQRVDLIDQSLKSCVFAAARMAQGNVDFGQHPAGIFLHHDDAIGQEDGLFDVVRHHQHRLSWDRFADPQLQQLATQRLGAQHVERAERFVEAKQLRLHRHGAREAALLPHAA